MKNFLPALVLSCLVCSVSAQTKTFHDYSAVTIEGDTISLSQYYGKKVMVVNTASYCGYTPQFAQLEQLYDQHKQSGFEIIGFPCNDFGSQDPGSDSVINQFCTSKYGVSFQMMSKIAVVSQDTAPVYTWLQRKNLNGVQNAAVSWNFHKFLIDEAGHWVKHYASTVLPTDTAIINWINSPSVLNSAHPIADGENGVQLLRANASSLELIVKTPYPANFRMDLYSVEGKFIGTVYDGPASDLQRIHYAAASLAPGFYFITVRSGDTLYAIKVVVAG